MFRFKKVNIFKYKLLVFFIHIILMVLYSNEMNKIISILNHLYWNKCNRFFRTVFNLIFKDYLNQQIM